MLQQVAFQNVQEFPKVQSWQSPKEALEYIRYIEKMIECPIKYVSVGAERDAYITMF